MENGLLVTTLTNASSVNTTNLERIGNVDRFKIIKADDVSLVLESDQQPRVTISYIRK